LGDGLSIDFKSEHPQFLNRNRIRGIGSRTSAITDEIGGLLLYTDGDSVWNKNHEPLENGFGLNSYLSGNPVTSVIVPHPGDGQLYYIFTANPGSNSNFPVSAFIYAIVDVAANSGKGKVIQKNIKLFERNTQLLTVVNHADEKSFWVITHGYGNNIFYAYKITESGISPPVASSIGTNYDDDTRQLKASPDGTKLAVSDYVMAHVFNFNAMSGEITDPLSIDLPGATGIEFSPNSEVLYVSNFAGWVQQFDVSRYDLNSIVNSRMKIGRSWVNQTSLSDLQLAYNGKIYVGKGAGAVNDSLITIHYPNISGLGCGYTNKGINLSNDRHYAFLPLSVQSYYRDSPTILTLPACTGLKAEVRVTSPGYADSLIWDFGDDHIEGFSAQNGKIVNHVYAQKGDYTISLKKYIGSLYREIKGTISIVDRPLVNLGADTVLCVGETLKLDGGSDGNTFQWSTGEDSRTIIIDKAGVYELEVNNGSCKSEDEITIHYKEYPKISLGDDRIICEPEFIELSLVPHENYTYEWSTGEKCHTITVNTSGDYTVTVDHGRCSVSDQVHVQFSPVKNLLLNQALFRGKYGEDISFEGQGVNIDSWRWTLGDGSERTTNVPHLTYRYNKAGEFKGELLASNSSGCSDTVLFEVNIPYHLFIPNVFTPNNDGVNDSFEIQYNGMGELKVQIYNRWGDIVFSTTTLEKFWNGTNVSSGTYYYIISGGKTAHKGWVSILR
jgi:gliding motility-associated-like protein